MGGGRGDAPPSRGLPASRAAPEARGDSALTRQHLGLQDQEEPRPPAVFRNAGPGLPPAGRWLEWGSTSPRVGTASAEGPRGAQRGRVLGAQSRSTGQRPAEGEPPGLCTPPAGRAPCRESPSGAGPLRLRLITRHDRHPRSLSGGCWFMVPGGWEERVERSPAQARGLCCHYQAVLCLGTRHGLVPTGAP